MTARLERYAELMLMRNKERNKELKARKLARNLGRPAPGWRAENARFSNRLQFGRSKFWKDPEPRSLVGSTWPMLEEAVRKYGIESLGRMA